MALTILYGRIRVAYAIGTLFALFIVNVAVIRLRRTKPDMERGFRVPLCPSSR